MEHAQCCDKGRQKIVWRDNRWRLYHSYGGSLTPVRWFYIPVDFCPFCGCDLNQATIGDPPVPSASEAAMLHDGPIPVVFDIDGVICENGSVDYSQAKPYPHAIEIINKLYDERDERGRRVFDIRLQTARYMLRCHGDQRPHGGPHRLGDEGRRFELRGAQCCVDFGGTLLDTAPPSPPA